MGPQIMCSSYSPSYPGIMFPPYCNLIDMPLDISHSRPRKRSHPLPIYSLFRRICEYYCRKISYPGCGTCYNRCVIKLLIIRQLFDKPLPETPKEFNPQVCFPQNICRTLSICVNTLALTGAVKEYNYNRKEKGSRIHV